MPGASGWLCRAGENSGPCGERLACEQPIALNAFVNPSQLKLSSHHHLDVLTQGAFSAPTSGERAARIRQWLASGPSAEDLHQVFKELSGRDKGAAKPVREKLDEIKRAKGQESLASEWAARGTALLELSKLNIADALAWQRDAAKAGAPLSREPLATIKAALAERVKGVEDLIFEIGKTPVGNLVELTVDRNEDIMKISIKVAERPDLPY